MNTPTLSELLAALSVMRHALERIADSSGPIMSRREMMLLARDALRASDSQRATHSAR